MSDKSSAGHATKNALEWTVFGISTLLVLTTLGFLVYSTVTVTEGPALMRAQAGDPISKDGWIRIPVTVRNQGESVAANVEVKVILGTGAEKREAGFSVDFVPREGSRTGSVSFKDTGGPLILQCEVVGYEEP